MSDLAFWVIVYLCMCACVCVLWLCQILFLQYYAKRLARKNVSEMTCVESDLKAESINPAWRRGC